MLFATTSFKTPSIYYEETFDWKQAPSNSFNFASFFPAPSQSIGIQAISYLSLRSIQLAFYSQKLSEC